MKEASDDDQFLYNTWRSVVELFSKECIDAVKAVKDSHWQPTPEVSNPNPNPNPSPSLQP